MRRDPSRRIRHLAALLVALPVAASFVIAQPPASVDAAASRGCNRWHSLTQPPDTIRVLRTRSNNVQTVSFRRYVLIVMAKEWPSYLPQQVVEAGAVAVKQYAWYHALYTTRSSRGGCFDVKDSTGDQIYRPRNNRPSYDHYQALAATWNVSLRRHGNFIMTAYRRGAKVSCGRDSNGNRLYALSAKHCAERHGYGWRQILREYYGNISFVEGGGGAGAQRSVSAPATPPAGATGTTNAPDSSVPADPTDTPTAPTPPTTSTAPTTLAAVGHGAIGRVTAYNAPGVLPENAGFEAVADPRPQAPGTPIGEAPPRPVIAAINDSAMALRPDTPAAAGTAMSQSWSSPTVVLIAAFTAVAFLLKRRRGYLP